MSVAIAAMCITTTAVMANTNTETLFQDQAKAAKLETPKFSTDEANKAVGEFTKLMDEYGPSLAKNDAAKSAEFGEKIQAWSVNVQEWMAKLSPEEQQKLGTFLDAYAQQYVPAQAPPPATTAPASVTD